MSSASSQVHSQEEFDPTQDSTARNYARVMCHVVQKGFQMGGVVGTMVVAPIFLFRHMRKGGQLADAAPKVANALFKTALTTTAVATALGVARLSSQEDLKAAVEDRAYRLHYNAGQNRADLFAQVGIAAGATAGLMLLPASAAAVVGGAAWGAACGIAAHVATSPYNKKEGE